jgi:hypothetical protein
MTQVRIHCRSDWAGFDPTNAQVTLRLVPDLEQDELFAEVTATNVDLLADTLDAYTRCLYPHGWFRLHRVPGKLSWMIDCAPGASVLLEYLVQGLYPFGHDGPDATFFEAIIIDHPRHLTPSVSFHPMTPEHGFCDSQGNPLAGQEVKRFRGAIMGMVLMVPEDRIALLTQVMECFSDCIESLCFVPIPDQVHRDGMVSSAMLDVTASGHRILRLSNCNGHPSEALTLLSSLNFVLGQFSVPPVVIFGSPSTATRNGG